MVPSNVITEGCEMKLSGTLLQMGNNTGIEVPEDIVARRREGGYQRLSVSEHYRPYGRQGAHPLQFRTSSCQRHQRGDTIEVTLERDDEPRIVEIPSDL
jgi:hypothetical protein